MSDLLARNWVTKFNFTLLRTILKKKNISIAELSRRTSIGRITLQNVVRGLYPTPNVFYAIAQALDLDPASLLTSPPKTLEEYRWLTGLSLSQAAKQWGIPHSTLSRLEINESKLREPQVYLLAAKLNLSTEEVRRLQKHPPSL